MATSQKNSFVDVDAKLCSICFEKYKTPRYLPCKHSFCHDCLHSYIVSQCKSTEPRLGFHCPLCRVYIPIHGDPEKPEEWAGLYPVNDVVQKLVHGPDEKLCEPCLRENEKEESSDYCLSCNEYLCMLCSKCHRKSMASKDHMIIKVGEILPMQIIPEKGLVRGCPKHNNEKIQLYCHDHEKPCCCLCAGTEHRKCEEVDTIDNAAHFLRESGQIDTMLCEMNAFKKKLLKVKTKEMNNISKIEDTVDENIAKTEKEASAMVQHIEQLKREHIDEMVLLLKKGREKLKREIKRIEDGVFCVDSCKDDIEKAQGTKNSIEIIMAFLTAKEKFQKIKQVSLVDITVNISAVNELSLIEISANMNRIAKVNLSVNTRLLQIDTTTIELITFKEFTIEDGNIFCGSFLSKERFLFVNYSSDATSLVFDKNWDTIHAIDCLHCPFGAIQYQDEIFVTTPLSSIVDVFSSDDLFKLRSFHLKSCIYGVTCWRGNLYAACLIKILKLDRKGEILQTYDLNGNNVTHITTTASGLIVYSDWKLETVTAMDNEGCKAWKYQAHDLKQPRELDVDSNDNIYIAGSKSNNIHVLSSSGKRVRVVENIPTPIFCKINEDEGIMCVCSGMRNIKLYKF